MLNQKTKKIIFNSLIGHEMYVCWFQKHVVFMALLLVMQKKKKCGGGSSPLSLLFHVNLGGKNNQHLKWSKNQKNHFHIKTNTCFLVKVLYILSIMLHWLGSLNKHPPPIHTQSKTEHIFMNEKKVNKLQT